MSILECKGSDPLEAFRVQTVRRIPYTNSFIAVAQHERTGHPIDVTVNWPQVVYVLLTCFRPKDALWYLEQLSDHNLIELKSEGGTPLVVSADEMLKFWFNQDDVHRIIK